MVAITKEIVFEAISELLAQSQHVYETKVRIYIPNCHSKKALRRKLQKIGASKPQIKQMLKTFKKC